MRREQIHQMIDNMLDVKSLVFRKLLSKEAEKHFQTTSKEALLGVKCILDDMIDSLNEEKETDSSSRRKASISARTVEIKD